MAWRGSTPYLIRRLSPLEQDRPPDASSYGLGGPSRSSAFVPAQVRGKGKGARLCGRAWGTDGAVFARRLRPTFPGSRSGFGRFQSPLNDAVIHGSGGRPRPVRSPLGIFVWRRVEEGGRGLPRPRPLGEPPPSLGPQRFSGSRGPIKVSVRRTPSSLWISLVIVSMSCGASRAWTLATRLNWPGTS